MNTSKKIISLLMCMLMVLTMAPISVFAEDTATYISEIRATSNFAAPEYSDVYYSPEFTFTLETDLPVTIASGGSADWFRWVDDDWNDTIESGEYFIEGTYCYDVKITLDDDTNYYWDENTKLYVDGVEWTDFSCDYWTKSPAFEISYVAGKPLIAGFNGQIGDSFTGLPLDQSNNTVTAVGGTMPYTFTKVSGPEWLTVSDTGVISGTPTVVGNNDALVIKVTDAVGEETTVSIYVSETYLNPDERQVISRIVGTVDTRTLRCGDSGRTVREFTARLIEGAPAELHIDASDLYDSSMNNMGSSALVAGEYYMDIEVVVSGEYGYTHMLDKENLEVIINGQTAIEVNPTVLKNTSYDWVTFGGIVVEHWFDNDTDATCNGCTYTREGCDHQYVGICGDTCTVCGATRVVEHEYNNACDHDCNLCGAVRVPSDHVWTDCYDKYCGVCNFYRDNGHVYDDCADDVCNICEYVRTPGHTYSSATDETCDVCGATRTLNYIQMGETKTVNIVNGGDFAEFLFTPTTTMIYSFYAMGEYDTFGYIFDEAYNQLTYNDDSAGDRNFAAVLELTAGTTYVLRANMYNSSQTGTFTVKVGCETHTYTDDCDEICDICGAERNDVPHIWSNACDAECNVCGETRVPADHVYTNLLDTDCDVCSAAREIRTITPGVTEDVEIATPGQVVDFIFIPTVSGKYYFFSESGGTLDTMGYVLNVDGNVLDDDDQSGGNGHFKTEYEMTAGTTYVLRAKLFYSDATGSFTVRLVCQNHTYGTDCTTECDICGAERNDVPHVWSNACDAECDNCDATRTPSEHVYTNLVDADCDICGENRTLNYININEIKNVDIDVAEKAVDFIFIPEVSGTYVFISSSENSLDTHGYIYDAENTLLNNNDDGAGNTHFKVVYEMSAGTPYILRAKMHSSTATGSFSVKITCNEHVYTDICDADCNVCGETREVSHYYDNDCDAQCNECSATRTPADHIYDNACDTTCNECGAERSVSDHIYDNACDKNCNICNYSRTVPDHVYDDDCDTLCNECMFVRYSEHNYDDYLDTECNDCAHVRTLRYIQYGDTKTVDITLPGEKVSFIFTPTVTGNYCFSSHETDTNVDSYGYILNVNGGSIDSDDDDGGDGMFLITRKLEAGTTYVLQAKLYSGVKTGSFEVTLTCGEHYFDNDCDAECNVCGETRTVPDHIYDNACDSQCNVCSDTREVPDHIYDNYCDAECNVCSESRTVGDHIYNGVCDADCNECGATRTVPDHIYDNACDTVCNECDAERTITHDYEDATCTAPKTCKVCGATSGKENGHSWLDATCTASKTCSACGETEGKANDHTGGTATCTEKAKCSVCGEAYGSVNKNNHKSLTTLKAVAATCTKTGLTEGKKCSVCGVTTVAQKTVAKKAHTLTTLKAVAATYKADGKTEGKKCADCGTVTVAQKKVARKTLKKVSGLKTKAVKLASGTKTTLTLSWSKVTGAEKYQVQQYVNKKWKTIKTTSKTSYTVTKLKTNKSYKFRVRAVAGKYYGKYSSTYTAKTVPLKTTLTLKSGKKALTASWKTVANITGYEVTYSTSKKFTKKTTKTVTIKKAKTKKTTIKKLSKGKKYYVKVRAYKTVGKTKIYSAWSAVKSVKVK